MDPIVDPITGAEAVVTAGRAPGLAPPMVDSVAVDALAERVWAPG